MNILVLGASGGVGKHVLRLARAQGHRCTAIARAPIAGEEGVVVDDVLRPGCFDDHVKGHDVVLSSLGFRRTNPKNPFSPLTSPTDFNSSTATALVAAMKKHGVKRVIAVSAAGVAESAPRMNFVMKFLVAKSNIGPAYRDLAVMERIYADSGLSWSCPRPVTLTNGALTQKIKVIDSFPMTATISRADVAWWMLQEAQKEAPASSPPTPIITAA